MRALDLVKSLSSADATIEQQEQETAYTHAFLYKLLELLIDLLSTKPTRKYLHGFLQHRGVSVRFQHAFSTSVRTSDTNNVSVSSSSLLLKLIHMLQEMESYCTATTASLVHEDMDLTNVHALQKVCHKLFPSKLEELVYAGVHAASNAQYLYQELSQHLSTEELKSLCHALRIYISPHELGSTAAEDRALLLKLICHVHAARTNHVHKLHAMPLCPDETLLWNYKTNVTAMAHYKLNIQFVSLQDYLYRNFMLYQQESAYSIRSDITRVLQRLQPVLRANNTTVFQGWSRMGMELSSCEIKEVSQAKLGTSIPQRVLAVLEYDMSMCSDSLRDEWDDSLREWDVLFLVSVDASYRIGQESNEDEDEDDKDRYGVMAVRGCQIVSITDSDGNPIHQDPSTHAPHTNTHTQDDSPSKSLSTTNKSIRRIKVSIDAAQYANDVRNKNTAVYERMNLLVRRDARTNNFYSVLQTIQSMLLENQQHQGQGQHHNGMLPVWMENILLGYTHTNENANDLQRNGMKEDWRDTFIDENHLLSSFPDYNVNIVHQDNGDDLDETNDKKDEKVVQGYELSIHESTKEVYAHPYPYHHNRIPHAMDNNINTIQYTPKQIQAIQTSSKNGLTLIVGPPGTGKTDVAVRIITQLYHNHPSQRILIITHSNAALNDIFAKLMKSESIPLRYLLRLGRGERMLQKLLQKEDESGAEGEAAAYDKVGRVAHTLQVRTALLTKVKKLSISLKVINTNDNKEGDGFEYTCETAEYFHRHHVKGRIEAFEQKFQSIIRATEDLHDEEQIDVFSIFPFKEFCLSSSSSSLTITQARKHFQEIHQLFQELEEFRPLELLRSQRQRVNYMLTKQAKVIAMTCTHASMIRQQLLDLNFGFDSIVMEEAGQMLEIETFVPVLLQKSVHGDNKNRLKRLVLIGDHHQLPPVVKDRSLQRYSRLDQSMFARLIRLGVPNIIQLDQQGRARPQIARLYSWRYNSIPIDEYNNNANQSPSQNESIGLKNLESLSTRPAFQRANPGFKFTHQFVNVLDYQGRGESSPTKFYYQNLGEAEYVVATFQYMTLIGYDPSKISILAAYQGQKALINDILRQRCGANTQFAGVWPKAVSTIDQYQGQQNDYVLLSLVRTKSIGFLRDVRRFVVAVSRARLGLYVFGRASLFEKVHELRPIMNVFEENNKSNPFDLELVVGEHFDTCVRTVNGIEDGDAGTKLSFFKVKDVETMGSIVYSMQQQ